MYFYGDNLCHTLEITEDITKKLDITNWFIYKLLYMIFNIFNVNMFDL